MAFIRFKKSAVVAVAALMLVASACNGDGGGVVTEEGSGTGTGTGSATGTGTGSGTATAAEPPVSIEGEVNNHGSESLAGAEPGLALEADDFYFAPTFVDVDQNATVAVTVTNEGDAAHTFTIDELDIDEEIEPGDSVEVEVALPASGPVVFYCRFHGPGGMQGAFAIG